MARPARRKIRAAKAPKPSPPPTPPTRKNGYKGDHDDDDGEYDENDNNSDSNEKEIDDNVVDDEDDDDYEDHGHDNTDEDGKVNRRRATKKSSAMDLSKVRTKRKVAVKQAKSTSPRPGKRRAVASPSTRVTPKRQPKRPNHEQTVGIIRDMFLQQGELWKAQAEAFSHQGTTITKRKRTLLTQQEPWSGLLQSHRNTMVTPNDSLPTLVFGENARIVDTDELGQECIKGLKQRLKQVRCWKLQGFTRGDDEGVVGSNQGEGDDDSNQNEEDSKQDEEGSKLRREDSNQKVEDSNQEEEDSNKDEDDSSQDEEGSDVSEASTDDS